MDDGRSKRRVRRSARYVRCSPGQPLETGPAICRKRWCWRKQQAKSAPRRAAGYSGRAASYETGNQRFPQAAAYFLAGAILAGEPVGDFILALEATDWLSQFLPLIYSYLDAPKTLEQLQDAAQNPKPGYDVHHTVEQTPARQDGYPKSLIDDPENLVGIPTLKHWLISAWFSRNNLAFGDVSPREYLRGKPWNERVWVGRQALRMYGVLKPVTRLNDHSIATSELVDRFADNCIDQNKALFDDDISRFNRLYKTMVLIRDVLKSRPGDQRRELRKLFDHDDLQVRLQAATVALAVAPQEARSVIEKIAASQRFPQAGDAGMTLWNLDRGVFVPK